MGSAPDNKLLRLAALGILAMTAVLVAALATLLL